MCSPAPTRNPAQPRWLVPALACLLLTIFAALCLRTAHDMSITFDEPEQVAVGYASLTKPGHGYSVINLRLSQIWEALPFLAFDPKPEFPSWVTQKAFSSQNIGYGRLFFFQGGRDAQQMIFASRAMVIILGLALGGVIFWYSRRLHGDLAGLLSLSLYVFCPLVIAHSSLATTDIATALLFTLSTLALWRLLGRPTPVNLILAGLATGALAATKISSLLIVPVALLLIAARWIERKRGAHNDVLAPGWARILFSLFGAALVSWIVVWLIYGGPAAAPAAEPQPWAVHPTVAGRLSIRLINLAREWRALPEAYLFDLHQFAHSGEIRRAYFMGRYSIDGWWSFFPVAWLVKNPLAFLAALAAAVVVVWRVFRTNPGERGPDWSGLAPLLALALVYGGVSVVGNLNIGARHLLPLFPPALILAGLAPRLLPPKPRHRAALVGALAACAALETAVASPHYLGFFNALAGGSENGRHLMVDSSTDWGESLPLVKQWMESRKARPRQSPSASPVYLSCFANTDYAYYGLDDRTVVPLPQYYDDRQTRFYRLLPGSYVISATMLSCVYNGIAMGPWRPSLEKAYQENLLHMAELQPALQSPAGLEALFARDGRDVWLKRIRDFDYLRFGRLCARLRQREPDEHIGPGMLVFEVTIEDLQSALAGPPPELLPDGAIKGTKRFADDDLDFIK